MSLPNASGMAVEVKVHETSVDKVKPGQNANIIVDAFQDKTFRGEVLSISPLPDPQSFLSNPDSKVYSTDVGILDQADSLKPGLSAKVEIIVARLEDVIAVPIQSVTNRNGRKYCYIAGSNSPEQREVTTGHFTDSFVEITSGLKPGEEILINPPRILAADGINIDDRKSPKKRPDKPKSKPQGKAG
jgi:multidrug efflux pump subunit AcrA (membrane-fusion protein)